MELNSFKELLLKKADGNSDLQTLIRFINNDILADEIIESLEKMSAAKGDKANSAITSFAGSATNADINMLHDAIGHHLSHFAAANKAHPPKEGKATITQNYTTHEGPNPTQKVSTHETAHHELDPVAKQHLERAMHLADFAAKASKHSLGKMNFDHVPTHAWEMNRTGDATRKNANGQSKYVDDQQGLKRRPQASSKKFPDYGYLLADPHPSYKHKGKLRGHEGQYPFEEMKINNKHVHIDPTVQAQDKYVEHPFDKHPLFQKEGSSPVWEKSEDSRTDAHRQSFADAMSKWHESPQFNGWLDQQEALENANPTEYAQRGSAPSKLLEGVRKKSHSVEPEQAPAPQEERAPASPSVPPAQSSAPKTVTRKAIPTTQDPHIQKVIDDYNAGDPKAIEFFNKYPEFKKKYGVQ